MKHFIITIALLIAGFSFATAQEYDTTDILWQKYIWPNACGGGKFSPDGKIIYAFYGEYSGSLSNKIIKLSAETGDSIGEFSGLHCGLGNDFELEISALGNYIITKGYGCGFLWDCRQERLLRSLHDTTGGVFSMCMSPNEEYILIGRADRYIIVYSPKEDREITRFNCGGSVLDLKFSHDGTKFAVCSYNYDKDLKQDIITLSLWETGTWKKIKDLYVTNDYSSGYFFLNFSYNDNLLSCNYGIIDINSKQISYPNDGMHKSKYFDFYINDTYCFFYSWDWQGFYSLYLYHIPTRKTVKKYKIKDGGIDCEVKTNMVFVNGYYWITMLKPTITSVPNEKPKELNMSIRAENEQLSLEITSSKSGLGTIQIHNITGQKLFESDLGFIEEGNHRKKLDIQLPTGVYFCKLKIDGFEITEKFQIGK